MRALVIGGTGFIGTAACKELMRRGVETIAASRREHPYGTFTSHVAFDRDDRDALRRVLAEVRPDVLLDMACYRPQQMRDVIELFQGERYVFVSTGSVYPPLNGRPAAEEEFTQVAGEPPPELDYADGKRWCETLLVRSSGFAWATVRPPIVLGAGDHTLRIAAYLQRVEDGGPVLVASETLDWPAVVGWSRDVGYVCALCCDVRRDVNGRTYNVGFEGVTVPSLVEEIARVMGKTPNIVAIPDAELPPAASPYALSPDSMRGYPIQRAREELGFEPSGIEDALAETLAWYRVARPSHPGYANRAQELEIARANQMH